MLTQRHIMFYHDFDGIEIITLKSDLHTRPVLSLLFLG